MVERTAGEVLTEYVERLGPDFGSVFFHAHNEWCELWLTWKQFENLFGHGQERVDLLNRAGASFFYRVDRYFIEAVMLAVCRLSDPAKSKGKLNLTVRCFPEFVSDPAKRDHLEVLLDKVVVATEFARDWRNRHISHNDHGLMVGRADPLKAATRKYMNAAINSLHSVFNYVSREFMDSNLHNEVIDELNNEMVMLDRLYRGDVAFQFELEKSRNGDDDAWSHTPNWLRPAKR